MKHLSKQVKDLWQWVDLGCRVFSHTYLKALPLALVLAVIANLPLLSEVFWSHHILSSFQRVLGYNFVLHLANTIIMGTILFEGWHAMHHRQVTLGMASEYVLGRVFRVVTVPLLLYILLLTLTMALIAIGVWLFHHYYFPLWCVRLFTGLTLVYLALRFIFLLPLVVLENASFLQAYQQAWQWSRGQMRQIIAVFIFPALVCIPLMLAAQWVVQFEVDILTLVLRIMVSAFVALVFNAFLLVLFYQAKELQKEESK